MAFPASPENCCSRDPVRVSHTSRAITEPRPAAAQPNQISWFQSRKRFGPRPAEAQPKKIVVGDATNCDWRWPNQGPSSPRRGSPKGAIRGKECHFCAVATADAVVNFRRSCVPSNTPSANTSMTSCVTRGGPAPSRLACSRSESVVAAAKGSPPGNWPKKCRGRSARPAWKKKCVEKSTKKCAVCQNLTKHKNAESERKAQKL